MSALTGSAESVGTEQTQEGIYLDSAPELWFQDVLGAYRFGPDSDGYYWGLSGTSTYPAHKIGCFTDWVFGDDVTMNDVVCDASGVESTIQKRGSIHMTFTLESLFPLEELRHMLRAGTVVTNAVEHAEKMGIGDITRKNEFWRFYAARIYDEDTGDFISFTLHKCQFVDAWEINAPFGDKWTIALQVRGFADSTKPAGQKFATVVRVDASVL